MKLIIDLDQSPQQLLSDLTKAVRIALGTTYYVEQAEDDSEQTNFTNVELIDPNVNRVDLTTAQVAASAGATPGAVETDSEGHPYDIRIHSAGKSKIANGTWKLKKGVDKALVEQVNAQNKQLMATPLPSSPPAAAGLPALPTLPTAVALPALPTLPPVAQVPAADVEINVTDYSSLAAYVAQQLVIKPVTTKTNVDTGLKHYGLVDANGEPDLTAVAHRPEVIGSLYPWLKAVIALGEG